MVERLPKFLDAYPTSNSCIATLYFDAALSIENFRELRELVSLKFAGQLRRDPNAPQTAPPQPGDEAAERSASTGER